ncbi:hypothetical protein GGI07_004777 [Coemansia sp. Benny D115]|nr:hypothetical protein GGI07_004777 [Coemansia sp. Benny D115]
MPHSDLDDADPSTPAAGLPRVAGICAWNGCRAEFATYHQLAAHLSATHLASTATASCAWQGCNQDLGTRSALIRHLSLHTGGRSFLCPEDGCGKVYKRTDFLRRHIETHRDPEAMAEAALPRSTQGRRVRGGSDPSVDLHTSDAESVSDGMAVALQAQLDYIAGQVDARKERLDKVKTKMRRLRMENDILIDALTRT